MNTAILRSTKVLVKDLEAQAKFYNAVVGLEEMARFKTSTGAYEILFKQREGESGLVLMAYTEVPANPQSNVVLVFATPDAEAFGKRVTAAGGKLLHEAYPVSHGGYDLTVLLASDPEGNTLEAIQMS
jgi:predicted enzyme related to lactoylglutathione lyase